MLPTNSGISPVTMKNASSSVPKTGSRTPGGSAYSLYDSEKLSLLPHGITFIKLWLPYNKWMFRQGSNICRIPWNLGPLSLPLYFICFDKYNFNNIKILNHERTLHSNVEQTKTSTHYLAIDTTTIQNYFSHEINSIK